MLNIDLGLDSFASRAIYRDFIAGKVINSHEILEGELQPSIKFRELIDKLDTYRQLYSLLGFEIQAINNEAFFITRDDRLEEYNEVAANIQIILTLLARGVYVLGLAPGIILDPTAGLTAKQINEIGELEEQARIIKACGLRLPLTESVNGYLLNRGICFKTKNERYILSPAGQFMFNEIVDAATIESNDVLLCNNMTDSKSVAE